MFSIFNKKPVIITIHGFGSKCSKEFDPFKKHFTTLGYSVITFNIYSINDPDDANIKDWIERCEKQIEQIKRQNKDYVIIGFSMGGVIASYLASIFDPKQLILVAPAFEYIDIKTMPDKLSHIKKSDTAPSSKQKKAFMNIVSTYRSSIAHVTCQTLFIHGTNDKTIPTFSSEHALKKVKGRSKLIYIYGAPHKLLYDGANEKTAFCLVEQMLLNKLF